MKDKLKVFDELFLKRTDYVSHKMPSLSLNRRDFQGCGQSSPPLSFRTGPLPALLHRCYTEGWPHPRTPAPRRTG